MREGGREGLGTDQPSWRYTLRYKVYDNDTESGYENINECISSFCVTYTQEKAPTVAIKTKQRCTKNSLFLTILTRKKVAAVATSKTVHEKYDCRYGSTCPPVKWRMRSL